MKIKAPRTALREISHGAITKTFYQAKQSKFRNFKMPLVLKL